MVCCIIIVLVSSWSKEHVKLAFHLHFFILPIIKLQHEKVKISVKTSSNISSYEWPGTYFMLWRTVKIFRAPTLCAEIHVQIPVLSFSGLFTFESVPFLGAFISVPTQKQLFQTKTFAPPHPNDLVVHHTTKAIYSSLDWWDCTTKSHASQNLLQHICWAGEAVPVVTPWTA